MKKIITVLLVLAIGMMTFTGCVQADTDDNSKNDSSSKNEITSNSRENSISKNDESKIENISSVNSNSSTESIDSPIEWSKIIITAESLNREKAIEELNSGYIKHNIYQAELEELLLLEEFQTIVGFDEAAIAITKDKYINTLTVDDKDFLLRRYCSTEESFYYIYNDILIVPIRIYYGKDEDELWFEYEFSVQTLSTPYFREAKCKETNCRVSANGEMDTSYVI